MSSGVEATARIVHRATPNPPTSARSHTDSDTKGSSDDAREDTKKLKKALLRKYRHTVAIHSKVRPSTLSHDATQTPSFIGFRNLGLIVLIAGNLRLLIENIQKYGVLICVRCHDFRRQDVKVGLVLYTLVPCCLMLAYLIELFAAYEARTSRLRAFNSKKDGSSSPTLEEQARFRTTWYFIMALHFANISTALVITSLVVYYYVNHPLIGTIVEMHAIIVWLKTASYALTNRDFRHAYLHPQTGEREAIPELYASCKYPENITFGNLCYFWWAPTLVYQPVYPRNDKIRWLFVLKRSAEVLGLCVAMWILSAQYAAPTLQNSLTALKNRDVAGTAERLLKLSTISLVIWLAGFFALFQSFLNALAEVMRFGDRSFYDDCVAFAGMLLQLPLVAFTKCFEKSESPTKRMIGNCIFWVTFSIFGQPAAALLYFYAWQIKYGSISDKWKYSRT
ncbi:hypothetical protein SLS63_003133 [Diaporthe eres]|uniref:O-acyltransferase n=1 Tax=Diaporthe eres TaxID=83184 RepID=A0ABR1PI03_DIAER